MELTSQSFKKTILKLKDSSNNYIEAMEEIIKTIDPINSPMYLGFIISLTSRKIELTEDKFKELIKLFNKTTSLLFDFLPEHFRSFIPSIDQLTVQSEISHAKDNKNIMHEFKKIIFETLIKKSKHEIWNNLNVFFNTKGYKEVSLDEKLHKVFINVLSLSNETQKLSIIKEIAYLVEPKDVLRLLQYFDENPEFIEHFFLSLKFTNRIAYDQMIETIYTEKRYFKEKIMSSLPDFDIDRVILYIKDYNWNVTAAIIEKRPEIVKKIIQAFHDNVLGMQRKFFLDSIAEQDLIFCEYLTELSLSTEEIVELSSKSFYFAKKYFYQIKTEEEMVQFCKFFTKKYEEHLLMYIKETLSYEFFEIFLKSILKTFRLTGELKNYVITNFSDDGRFFHPLISYLTMAEVEKNIEKFYQNEITIECLLRKSNPQELIIDLHKFKNDDFTVLLIAECVNNSKFEDNDWVLAMKSLEKIDSPIKINTCLLLLKNKVNLRGQSIMFIKRSMGESIWMFRRTISDLISCFEFLEEDSLSIFESMTREEIIFILKKSKAVERTLKNYLSRYHYKEMTSNMRFLEDCLRRM